MIQTTTLPNGIRIITDTVDKVRKVSMACAMISGSQCEPRELNGLAHYVEHCLFLGTKSLSQEDIHATERQLGCNFNAETHQERIVVSAEVLPEDFMMAITVLAEMIQFPTFPDTLVEAERNVILTEIAEVQDDDENFANNMMHVAAFKREPLGLPIEGSVKTVLKITPAALRAFHNAYFRPENLIISIAGPMEHDELVQQCVKLFGSFKNDSPVIMPPPTRYLGGELCVESNGDMDLFRIGFQGVPQKPYREYMCGEIFATILEDVLYEELRNKNGLLYSIHANNYAFANQGIFVISGTCYPKKLETILQKTCMCIYVAKNKLSAEMMVMAKKRIKLDLIANDGTLADRVDSNIFDLEYSGRSISLDESYRILDEITMEEVQKTAIRILQSRLAFSGLGHTRKMPSYSQIRKWLCEAEMATKKTKVMHHPASNQLTNKREQKTK